MKGRTLNTGQHDERIDMGRPRKVTLTTSPAERLQERVESRTVRAAIYIRVSTDGQARSGLGMEAQEGRCRREVQARGWSEPTLYTDAGISGAKGERHRPGLARLLSAVRAGAVDVVIIYRIDRLGRSVPIVLETVEEISQHAVVVSCSESIDTSSPNGKLLLTMFAMLAQYERDLASERTHEALRTKEQRDGDRGGELPYGYARKAGRIVPDPSEARWVRRIFAWRMLGHTFAQIAEELNAKGVPSPRGGQWGTAAVYYIAERVETYRGGKRGRTGQVELPAILKAA
jgi:site-specific DNA recombinase